MRVVQITSWQTSKCSISRDNDCFYKKKDNKCGKSQVRNVYCKHHRKSGGKPYEPV